QYINPCLYGDSKARVDIEIRTGGEVFDLPPEGRSRCLHVCDIARTVRIDQDGNAPGVRQQLKQEPEPLWPKLLVHGTYAGDIAAGPVEARDQTRFDRVRTDAEDDRNCRGCRFCRKCPGRAAWCGGDGYPATHQLGGQL